MADQDPLSDADQDELRRRYRKLVEKTGLSYAAVSRHLERNRNYVARRVSGSEPVRRFDVLALESLVRRLEED